MVRNDNFKKSSIGSVTNPQSDHLRNLQNYPNGTSPIFERILVQNDYKIPQTDNQHCSINTQNQLFTQLERRNHSKQNPEKSSQNGINLENSQNNSSPQNDNINQELRQQYPLQRTPILNYAQNFHHVKDLYQHQKQQVKHQLPQNKTQLPPTETIRGNQAHIKISERIFPQEKEGRHPNLPWASHSLAPPWPPPSLPQVPRHPPPRPCSKRQSTQALTAEAAYKLPRQNVTYPTRPPVVSLTELVALIGQNSQQTAQQLHFEPQEQVRSDPARSQEPLQCNAPILRSILDSDIAIQHNSTRVSHIVEPGHINPGPFCIEKTGTPAPPSQRDATATLPISPTDPIMLNRSRPTTNPKRPTHDHKVLNQNFMNEMHHTSHHEHAI